jgi:DNA replication ATP-dependent helicase Dna2
MFYLNQLTATPLAYPVVRGTVIHEVFGDLLRGRDLEPAVEDRVAEAGLELGLLGEDRESVTEEVRANAGAIEGWLAQGALTGDGGRPATDGDASAGASAGDDGDETDAEPWRAADWRPERTLLSERFGLKGRADAVRRGAPVELKTGKNTRREPRFHDKVQAACYALLLGEHAAAGDADATPLSAAPDTATLLYTKNAALDRGEADGDLAPAKDFSVGPGLLKFVLRERNGVAATLARDGVPTGYEADAICDYCFEQDTCRVISGRLDQESKAGRIGEPVPAAERAYVERFYRAIQAERRAVHAEYRKLWEQTAAERADDDRALIGLEPAGRERLPDGRWELRARRPGEAVSKLREGDVALASDGHPTRGTAEMARIERLGDDEVVVSVDAPLDLRRLDVYPSELSVDRQLSALHDAVLTGDPDRKAVLFGDREPAFSGERRTYIDNNDAQDEAVNRAVTAEEFALIHGPPGTGKTYTLARTVRALVERGERVLLSAFTNRAVDNALEALRAQGFDEFVRVGTASGVRADMQDARLRTRGDPADRAAALSDAPVVAATTATCGSRTMRTQEFDVAVVDEAGQLTEPGTLAAVTRADRFVLVGDHRQLPPVVRGDTDLATSLFERLIDDHPDAAVLLDRQYRMNQRIQWFPAREFYDGRLRPATPGVAARRVADLDGVDAAALPPALRDPVGFVDPDGRQDGNRNPVEADRVAEIVETYREAGVPAGDVGVIAPFRAQVAELSRRLDGTGVTVDTVDRFQGSSEEVIVVSFVATGSLDGPIFEDHRRVNVALTRAKRALCLVGDGEALGGEPFYARMLRWARTTGE